MRDNVASRWNVRAEVHAFDISDSANVDRLVALYPDIDILVNNAGAIPAGNLQEIDEARWREAWDLKVYGYINMCRRFYDEMKQRRRGVIVNILGMAGERMDAGYIAGSTGNAGLMAFTKTLGGAASADHLRVVGINPGAIATDRLVTVMKKRALDRLGDANRWEELMRPLPFGRAGTSEEIGWDGGLSRLRQVCLYQRHDHHDRRRRGQPRPDVLRGEAVMVREGGPSTSFWKIA